MALADITVLILSRGRDDILKRSLDYWATFPMTILVLHNTDTPLTTFHNCKNVKYINANIPYGERCKLASQHISTKYAILVSDDDFYLGSALLALSEALEQNEDLVSVGGQTISVGKYGKRVTGTSAYPHARDYKNLENSISGRLAKHFDIEVGYINGSMYRLFRAETFIELMDNLGSLSNIRTPYIFEVSSEIFANAAGKSKYLNQLLWIRNWINAPVNHSEWKRNFYFSDWVTHTDFLSEFNTWKEFLRSRLNLDQENFDSLISRVVEVRRISEQVEISRLKKRSIPIPETIKYFIRRIFKPKSLPNSLNEEIQKLIQSDVLLNTQEIETVLKFL